MEAASKLLGKRDGGRTSERKEAFADVVPKGAAPAPKQRRNPAGGPGASRGGSKVSAARGEGDDGPTPLTGHPEGPYGSHSETFGRYQNVANCAHMLTKLVRMSSNNTHTIDWQLGLRGNSSRKPDASWRRYFTRAQPSFDATREICDPKDEVFQTRANTPMQRHADRNRGGIKTATIREDSCHFDRYPGCEGAQAGQWVHLLNDRRSGPQCRAQLAHETSLRVSPGDQSGTMITDNRTDGCIVEMMGKKKWNNSRSWKPLAAHPAHGGDFKLHHLSVLKVEPEVDDEVRKMRVTKHPVRKGKPPEKSTPRA